MNAEHQRYADEKANAEQVARYVTQECQQLVDQRTDDGRQTMTKHLTTIPYTIHHTATTGGTGMHKIVFLAQCRYPCLRQDKRRVPPATVEHHPMPLHRPRGRRKARTATASLSMQKLANGEDGKKGAGRSDLQNVMQPHKKEMAGGKIGDPSTSPARWRDYVHHMNL